MAIASVSQEQVKNFVLLLDYTSATPHEENRSKPQINHSFTDLNKKKDVDKHGSLY